MDPDHGILYRYDGYPIDLQILESEEILEKRDSGI